MVAALTDVVGLTQALVKAPGLSGDEREASDIAFTAMEALGFRKVVRDDYGSVVGLVGPENADIVLLFDGHTDVVPAVGDWTVDPFGGTLHQGRLYGRGSTDMKGAVAAAICGVAKAAADGTLTKQVAVSASVMEEILEGVALGNILDAINPECVVICEPSNLELRIGQRGRLEIVLTIFGKPAHASQPQLGENPIEIAARAMDCLNNLVYREDPVLGKGVLVAVSIVSDPLPSPSMIPLKTTISFDRRTVAGETRETVFRQIQACLSENKINNFELYCNAEIASTYTGVELCPDRDFPSWTLPCEHHFARAGLRAIETAGLPARAGVWSCCTNGSESAGRRNIPTIGIGPGDIRDAHTIDESVEISQLIQAAEIYKNLVLDLAS